MRRPVFTPRAQADLRRITIESIDLFGTMQARIYFKRLETAAFDLASGHRMGRPFDEEKPDHLRFLMGAHYLVYKVGRDGGVLILRILHSRMGLSSHL